MLKQPIKFQYKAGIIIDGYSFSAYNNTITLSGYIEKLDNAKIREAILYEAETARSFYVEEVNRLKASGRKINSYLVKREAISKAKNKTQAKYAEIWSEVVDTYKTPPLSVEPSTSNMEGGNTKNIHLKNIALFVVVSDSKKLYDKLIETIEACHKVSDKVVDTS